MTNKELLISRLDLLTDEDIASLLDVAAHMEEKNTLTAKPDCPCCGSSAVIRYGHKCRKQRGGGHPSALPVRLQPLPALLYPVPVQVIEQEGVIQEAVLRPVPDGQPADVPVPIIGIGGLYPALRDDLADTSRRGVAVFRQDAASCTAPVPAVLSQIPEPSRIIIPIAHRLPARVRQAP